MASKRLDSGGRARDAARALKDAMAADEPACSGDPRFTASRPQPLSGEERRDLYLTCFECPIYEACAEYAAATRPAAGFWAGKNYGTWERKV